MKDIKIRPFSSAHSPALVKLQLAYSKIYPDAPVIPGEVYLSPAFEGNIFCAFDATGILVGYAPLYPVLMRDASKLPHTLWTEIRVHPACDAPDAVRDRLFDQVWQRAREVTRQFPGHPIHLTFQYFLSETASVDYVTSRGCRYTESVYTMQRDLSQEVPAAHVLDGIELRPWRMESEAEQQAYVNARSECFPEAPIALGEWQYFMQSPHWSVGTTFAAFDGDELVGNVAVFWDEAENLKSGNRIGFTEYIFVRPQWRGKRIAQSLINLALKHLQENRLAEAHLEVRAKNENALGLYCDLGYGVIRESRFYVLTM